MGIHGAGLANCVFGPPGVTVFEIQAGSITSVSIRSLKWHIWQAALM